ncbi:MAG: lipid A deacylase LpxR family protein [Desulfosarcina sp.]
MKSAPLYSKTVIVAFLFWSAVGMSPGVPAPVHAEPYQSIGDRSTFIVQLENDAFAKTDEHYTNAVKFDWISKDLRKIGEHGVLPAWARWVAETVPGLSREHALHNLAFSLGQNIYTPRDTDIVELIEDDRPYAGWTYLSAALHTKDRDVLNSLELTLGIVGPSSFAEETQKIVHEWLNDADPQGWDNQLEDELGVMLTWQGYWRVLGRSLGHGFAYDMIPHAGATLGNIFTYANFGGEIRFGYNLPRDFGSSLIRPGGGTAAPVSRRDPRLSSVRDFSLSFFVGVDGRAVARNIFLDGNTFRDSHSVDRNVFVADIDAGVSVIYKRVKLTYMHVYRTEEFEGQDDGQTFGSVAMAVTF